MTTFIYGLVCPLENTLKYIGKANNPHRRLKDHMYDIRGMTPEKVEWIGELRKYKVKPELVILDEICISEWEYWEAFYLGYFRSLGFQLINTSRSGNGLTYSNKQTWKPHNIPWNKGKKL